MARQLENRECLLKAVLCYGPVVGHNLLELAVVDPDAHRFVLEVVENVCHLLPLYFILLLSYLWLFSEGRRGLVEFVVKEVGLRLDWLCLFDLCEA